MFSFPAVPLIDSLRSLTVKGHTSRSRSIAVGVRGLSLSRAQDISNFSKTSRPDLGPTQPPVQCVPGDFPGVKRLGVKLSTDLHLAPRLRMNGFLLPLPLYGSVVWKGDKFTF